MTYSTPQMVVSGVPYHVTEVDGHEPSELAEFDTTTSFLVQDGDGPRRVAGCGHLDGEVVRFHEKDDGAGKDVRLWQVEREETGRFRATVV